MTLLGSATRRLSRLAGIRSFRLFSRLLADDRGAGSPAGFEVRPLSRAELATYCGDPELDLREDAVAAAHARGDFCVATHVAGSLAGYCWFAFAPLPHLDGVWVEFGPDVAWIYKSFVRPACRGRGLAPLLYRSGDAPSKERGRRVSIICVEAHNAASIRAALRAGYADLGRAAYLRRGPAFAQWRSPQVRERLVRFRVPARAGA